MGPICFVSDRVSLHSLSILELTMQPRLKLAENHLPLPPECGIKVLPAMPVSCLSSCVHGIDCQELSWLTLLPYSLKQVLSAYSLLI